MTAHMNTYDLQDAVWRFGLHVPNRAHVARVVRNLASWADENSDGWTYWPAPVRAAQKAIVEIQSTTHRENAAQEQTDLTDRQVRSVLAPIKAFTTKEIGRGRMTLAERDRIFAG